MSVHHIGCEHEEQGSKVRCTCSCSFSRSQPFPTSFPSPRAVQILSSSTPRCTWELSVHPDGGKKFSASLAAYRRAESSLGSLAVEQEAHARGSPAVWPDTHCLLPRSSSRTASRGGCGRAAANCMPSGGTSLSQEPSAWLHLPLTGGRFLWKQP